jgi:hypothetical protein
MEYNGRLVSRQKSPFCGVAKDHSELWMQLNASLNNTVL